MFFDYLQTLNFPNPDLTYLRASTRVPPVRKQEQREDKSSIKQTNKLEVLQQWVMVGIDDLFHLPFKIVESTYLPLLFQTVLPFMHNEVVNWEQAIVSTL